ncbi:MAG: phosphoenolpyruvate--protein phosphotransferase [Treponema sp.]
MIGIVLVSHSFDLAQGAFVLSSAMADGQACIAAAGGLADKTIGTDPLLILQAIESVYSEEGVLIFVDMGSALLSATFAIEMLDEAKQAHVVISDAPFIEGAVCAAVQARIHSPLPVIIQELRTALLPKQEQLGTAELADKDIVADSAPEPIPQAGHACVLTFHVHNTYGIHARPAAKIAALVGAYPHLTITAQKRGSSKPPVSALSLNALSLLGIQQHDTIEFHITGEPSEACCTALTDLAQHNFGDDIAVGAPPQRSTEVAAALQPTAHPMSEPSAGSLQGLIGAAGIAQGPARMVQWKKLTAPHTAPRTAAVEWADFCAACDAVKRDLNATAYEVHANGKPQEAAIFEAHRLMLEDPVLINRVRTTIFDSSYSAARAWEACMAELKESYRTSGNSYTQERMADIDELEQSVLAALLHADTAGTIQAEGILIASDLTPRQTAHLNTDYVKGICTAKGSSTSHTAIIARARGIPALMGIGSALLSIPEGTPLILDAQKGMLLIQPDEKLTATYTALQHQQAAEARTADAYKYEAAVTQNGTVISVYANVGSLQEAETALHSGADGIGLLRTEFLFLNRDTGPTEDEQYTAYCSIAEALGGKPVIIRTLDAGGDKAIPYLHLPQEANPFLGYRAIRILLDNPEFFRTQLRAVIRAAQRYPIKLMFPMISSLGELHAAQKELHIAYDELTGRHIDITRTVSVGMMIEVPSAALQASDFAKEVDFFSIGTNDLTQYTLAAERGNSRVAHVYSAVHPAVLTLIKLSIDAAKRAHIPVDVCGELAAEPEGARILCELGVDALSASAPFIPRLKAYVRTLDL